jgi:acetyl esterase/lipase
MEEQDHGTTVVRRGWLAIGLLCIGFIPALIIGWQLTRPNLPAPVGWPELDVGAPVVQWGSNADRSLYLHVLSPDDASQAAGVGPAVLFVHGARGNPGEFESQARAVAAAGNTGILVEYSTFGEGADTDAQGVDITKVVQYVRNNATELGVDPNRIVVVAASAGARAAIETLTVNTDPDAMPDAFVLLNPSIAVEYPSAAPTRPTLLLHGSNDELVPVDAALAVCESIGDMCEAKVFDGGVHGFFNEPDYRAEATADIVEFVSSLQ